MKKNNFYKLEKDVDIHFIINEKGYGKENWELQKRIDKAIEKIESVRIYGLRSGKTLIATLLNDVLDILKGSDSNE